MPTPGDISRRGFLKGAFDVRAAAVVASGGLVAAETIRRPPEDQLVVRPPGARPTAEFAATCLKCGQCVAACPPGALRLSGPSDEIAPIGTPFLSPREAPCVMCEDVPCARACPSGALRELPIREARMGLAVLIDQENCLAFQGLRCEACYRACPLLGVAITVENRPHAHSATHAYFLPRVAPDACTGCGMCEHACIMEEPAIRVLPRSLAEARVGAHYRISWREAGGASPELPAPPPPPRPADADQSSILNELGDLRALEDP